MSHTVLRQRMRQGLIKTYTEGKEDEHIAI